MKGQDVDLFPPFRLAITIELDVTPNLSSLIDNFILITHVGVSNNCINYLRKES